MRIRDLDIEGFKLHLKFTYPAFDFAGKNTDEIKKFILGYCDDVDIVLEFYEKLCDCPYPKKFIEKNFDINSVKSYWIGTGLNSHNPIRTIDFLLHKDLDLLNKCSVVPIYMREHEGDVIAEYYVYKKNDGRFVLVTERKKINYIFLDGIEDGDIALKHFDYAIEKIDKNKANELELQRQKILQFLNRELNFKDFRNSF